MKTKRLVIFGVVAALGIVYVVSIVPTFRHRSEWKKTVRALQNLSRERADEAIEGFVRDQKAKGRPVPGTVSLGELVAGGSLRAADAAPFNGLNVTFAIRGDETHPGQILARVPLRTGGVVVQLADGSIQGATTMTQHWRVRLSFSKSFKRAIGSCRAVAFGAAWIGLDMP